ncbi:hypothetical protein C2845_PM02G03350 [Panicum miliaceum]|uniref:Uncharacterized protein n=1 Tax=Panicum miliaceum TaxID=4540 RepID=A0A3L6S9Y7_PANMI|nr:hypothetical protein C2845_PM02G03350 [Panicum miliaceum]
MSSEEMEAKRKKEEAALKAATGGGGRGGTRGGCGSTRQTYGGDCCNLNRGRGGPRTNVAVTEETLCHSDGRASQIMGAMAEKQSSREFH